MHAAGKAGQRGQARRREGDPSTDFGVRSPNSFCSWASVVRLRLSPNHSVDGHGEPYLDLPTHPCRYGVCAGDDIHAVAANASRLSGWEGGTCC